LRRTFSDVSDRWAAVGGSQGGAAAWAADEQAATYAPEIHLVGAVAYVPAADVSRLVDKAQAGTMTTDQQVIYEMVVESLARLHNDVNRDDFRRGAAANYWDELTSCSGAKVSDRPAAAQALRPGDLAPSTPAAADRLRGLLEAWALPQQRLSAPLSVTFGGKDSFIDAKWTADAISRACALGGTVVWDLQQGKGHGDVDIESQPGWLADRFAGKPVANQCP
jgi:pimeloyl-ACP methyl ester carboxylesterase